MSRGAPSASAGIAPPGSAWRWSGITVCLALAFGIALGRGATPSWIVFQSGAGQFEVAGAETDAVRAVTVEAQLYWRLLRDPLALPDAFSSPILVRLIPGASWRDPAAFRVAVEPGGVVSLRVGWRDARALDYTRRGLVQALLLRVAVTRHGVNAQLAAPLWLEQACVGWRRTRDDLAQFDAWKQRAAAEAPVSMVELARWQRGEPEPVAWSDAALGLFTFLQAEGTKGEWADFLGRVLGGEPAEDALAHSYPDRFHNADERELWWRTGWHDLRRTRTLPLLSAAESADAVADAARFVFARDDRDLVLPLREALRATDQAVVAAAVRGHLAELRRVTPALHPFYRNAGLSLADALALAGAATPAARQDAAVAAFESDWRDARELQQASTAALDALERSGAAGR